MKNETKSYTIELYGESYTIVSDESQEHINQVVAHVQQLLTDIMNNLNFPKHEIKKAAILASLRLASDLLHMQQRINQQAQQQTHLAHYLEQLIGSL